jgi:hypothetical protein
MLVPRWKVEYLPVFEGSCWQIRVAEGGASFSDDGCWLSSPGGPELNFDVRLKEKNSLTTMPAVTNSIILIRIRLNVPLVRLL